MWPSTHVCYANYATIMISPESGWSISKCFERFIAGNLITETFPESNIVQIKSRVNSPLLYFELDRSFFFFFFRFDEKTTSRIWVEFRVYSSAIFMEWRIETKRSRRTKDNENIPGIPPISTLEHIPSVLPYMEFFSNLCSIRKCFFQTDENIKSRKKGDRCY